MSWEDYQHGIAQLFRLLANAHVQEDIALPGASGLDRQIDVYVELAMTITLPVDLQVQLPIKIIVDAKQHVAPPDVGYVEEIDGMRADVGANIAIIASSSGFTAGAKQRAVGTSVLLLTATSDLLNLLTDLSVPWGSDCVVPCADDVTVHWNEPDVSGVPYGRCENCNRLHVMCPDCGIVFAINDDQMETRLKCPTDSCVRRLFIANDGEVVITTYDNLEVEMLLAANGNTTRKLSRGRVGKLISLTKWQYSRHHDPSQRLVKRDLFRWVGDFFVLTESGEQVLVDRILAPAAPAHTRFFPDIEALDAILGDPSEADGDD